MRSGLHRFSTRSLPARSRYDAWAGRSWPSLAAAFQTRRLASDFRAETESLVSPGLTLTEAWMSALAYERPQSLAARDGLDQMGVCVLLSGRMRGEAGNFGWTLGPGGVLVGDFAQAHRWESTDSHALTLTLPRAAAEAALPAVRSLHGLAVSPAAAAPFVDPLLALWRHLRTGRIGTEVAAEAVVSLLAMILGRDAPSGPSDSLEVAYGGHIEALIALRCSDPRFDAAALARAMGVSRATLYRMVGPERGVAGLIRTARLARLRAMLADPRDRRGVTQIVYAAGFGDRATATRAFRTAHGMSPRDYRAMQGRGRHSAP